MKRNRKDYIGYLMVAPAYTVYILFVFLPLLVAIYYSFTNYDFYQTSDFVGIKNYIRLFKDNLFLTSIKNTLVYSMMTIVPQMIIGLLLAILVNRKIIGKNLHRAAIYLPNVLSMVAISMIWLYIYDPTIGILNRILKVIGLSPNQWLFNSETAMFAIVVMSIWKGLGYCVITYLAGLQSIPESLYEAARIDGANAWQQTYRITVPMLNTTTFFLFVITTIGSFNVFEQVNIMTNGGPLNSTTTIVHQIYINAFRDFQMGYASSMAVVLFLITMTITMIFFKYGNQRKDMEA